MSELAVSFEEFRRIARDFLVAAPKAPDLASLDNGQKCVALAYLNCQHDESTSLGRHNAQTTAPIILNMCTKAFVLREIELEKEASS